MTGLPGSHRSYLDGEHASGCDGKEFTKGVIAPWGDGFAVVRLEWCGECGAIDWEAVDYNEPEPGP